MINGTRRDDLKFTSEKQLKQKQNKDFWNGSKYLMKGDIFADFWDLIKPTRAKQQQQELKMKLKKNKSQKLKEINIRKIHTHTV